MMADRGAAFEAIVEVHGRDRVSRALRLPADVNAIVFAKEKDADVTLEVSSAGRVVGRADAPIRRTGIQRTSFLTRGSAEYFVSVVGKGRADASGSATLRVVIPERSDACARAQQMLAAADAQYAVGQSVTQGVGSGANVQKAYSSAAGTYEATADQLDRTRQGTLAAQASHAAAAILYQDIHDYAGSYSWAQRAGRAYRAIDDEYGNARAEALEAAALMEIAVSQESPPAGLDIPPASGEMLQRARDLFGALAELHSRRGESYDRALALNNIGLSHYYAGANDAAIRAYRRALELYEQLHERSRQVLVLQNVALAEYELGRFSDATARYDKLLQLITPAEEPGLYASILNNSALANWGIGNVDKALRQYGEALDLQQTLQSPRDEARSFHGIGAVYDAIGDRDLALDFYKQALERRTASLDARGQTTLLRAIASILRDQGHAADALKMHQQALALAAAPATRTRISIQIAKDLEALGENADARRQLDDIVQRNAGGDRLALGQALLERGTCRIANGELDAAEADLRRAAHLFHELEQLADEFNAWVALARLKRQRGATEAAFAAVNRALTLAEEVRLRSANPELRAALLQPLRPAFDLKISMLAAQYFAQRSEKTDANVERIAFEALMTAEQARARALADFQSLDVASPGVAPELVKRRQAVYRELAGRRFQLEAILDGTVAGDSLLDSLHTEIAELRSQLDEINARIASASAGTAPRGRQGASLVHADLRTIPANVAIIEYWLGSDDALAWVLTRARLEMVLLGKSANLIDAASRFHGALRNFGTVPQEQRLNLGEKLYELAMAPLADHAQQKRTLIFIPDSALHYIPFAALRFKTDGRAQFLVEKHDIAIAPAVVMLFRGRTPPSKTPTRQMLLVDDPVYELGDGRLATLAGRKSAEENKPGTIRQLVMRGPMNMQPLSRLPGTADEAATIASLLPRSSIDRLEGFAATRDNFLRAGLDQYRYIHVASHAVTDSEVPQLSALILSTLDRQGRQIDGRVLAADLMATQLNADAVILSACDTALGKNVSGEGLVGLRYAVLARGAKSVIASLWQVPDQAGAQLIAAFYTLLLSDKGTVTAALSEAMRATLKGRLRDPALWGAMSATVSEMDGSSARLSLR